VAREEDSAELWDLTPPNTPPPIPLAGHNRPLTTLAVSPDGRFLATASQDETVRLWDLTARFPALTGVLLRGAKGAVTALLFDPASHWLFAGGADGTVRRYNLRLDELVDLACRNAAHNLTSEAGGQAV